MSNQSNGLHPVDPYAAAFIAHVKSAFPHSNVGRRSQQQITEELPLAATVYAQSCKMMAQFYTDSSILWRKYADRFAHDELPTVPHDDDRYEDDRSVSCWEIGNYTLKVFPMDTDDHISFAIFDVEEPIFTFPLDRTIVHLFLPFSYHDDHIAECTLNDEIYWINGDQVIAAGVIDRVLQLDVITTNQGLIVPVVVMPFVYRFRPFAFEDAVEGDHRDAYLALNAERNSISTKSEKTWPSHCAHDADIPRVAVEIDRNLGLDIMIYIEDGKAEKLPCTE